MKTDFLFNNLRTIKQLFLAYIMKIIILLVTYAKHYSVFAVMLDNVYVLFLFQFFLFQF